MMNAQQTENISKYIACNFSALHNIFSLSSSYRILFKFVTKKIDLLILRIFRVSGLCLQLLLSLQLHFLELLKRVAAYWHQMRFTKQKFFLLLVKQISTSRKHKTDFFISAR